MTTSDQRDRDRRRRTVAPSTGTSGAGQLSMQVGADGVEPAFGIGGGMTVSPDGDLGVKVGGVSLDTGADIW